MPAPGEKTGRRPGDLGTFSSLWTFIAPGSPGQDRCLCFAALKVYIAQLNQIFLLFKTLAFPAESCVTNSTNLPWVYFSGDFFIKCLLHSSFIVGCSISPLPALFQAEERGVQERPPLLLIPLSRSFPSRRAPPVAEARMRCSRIPCPMSPRPSWLHPLAAVPTPGPAFPGKLLRRLPPTRLECFAGRGLWHRAVLR